MKLKYSLTRMSAAAVVTAACASAPSQRPYIAPTEQTVFTTVEEMSTSPGQIVYVENRSSVPVTVYSVTLRECENVKGSGCSPHPLNLRLQPNSRAMLVRVEPASADRSFNFRYSFGWRADSTTTAALGALASVGDSSARKTLDAMTREQARRRGAVGASDLDLTASEVAQFGERAGGLRVLPDSLVLPVGGRITLDTVRVLLIGAQGETLGRVRALQWRLAGSPAITLVRPDTVIGIAAGRATLQLKIGDDVLPAKPTLHGPLEVPIIVRP